MERCDFCRMPIDLGHFTYCPYWEEWDIEQREAEENDDRENYWAR